MAKIIAFANQKGGVGKTTSAINVAAALGLKRKNTLLVDFDPQGNSTSGVGIRKSQVKNTIYDALVGKASPHDCIIKTEYKNLSVMPSELSLAAAELELADTEKRELSADTNLCCASISYSYSIVSHLFFFVKSFSLQKNIFP